LDINARAWGFHSLGMPAGVDFPYILFADQLGKSVDRCKALPGVGWLRALTDVPTVVSGLWDRELDLRSYWKSIHHTRTESVFCLRDPLPFFAEFAMLPYLLTKKYFTKSERKLESRSADVPGADPLSTTESVK
jgi:D-aspartate ligase